MHFVHNLCIIRDGIGLCEDQKVEFDINGRVVSRS